MKSATSSPFGGRFASVPEELRRRKQWVVWRKECREADGDPTKVPYHAGANTYRASTIKPKDWTTFGSAVACASNAKFKMEGIGYVFSSHDPYIGVDIDDCMDESGNLSDFAVRILSRLNTRSEISPSRKGVKAILKGTLPKGCKGKRNAHLGLEIYGESRYFTVTGEVLPGYSPLIEDRSGEILALFKEIFGEGKTFRREDSVLRPLQPLDKTDEELLETMFRAKNGTDIYNLFHLGSESAGFASCSEAVGSLLFHFAFYTQRDSFRMERLFLQSKVAEEWGSKWDRLRSSELGQACAKTTRVYTPDYHSPPPPSFAHRSSPASFSALDESPSDMNPPLDLDLEIPRNLEAEASTLGALLAESSVVEPIFKMLLSRDFYHEAHARICAAMLNLHARERPLDLVTVGEELQRLKVFETVGGIDYLRSLMENTPNPLDGPSYALIVKEKSNLRRIIQHCQEGIRSATAGDVSTWKSTGLPEITKCASPVQATTTENLIKASDVVRTEIDWIWDDRIAAKSITIIEGDPGIGKSTVCKALVTAITFGHGLPGQGAYEPRNVLLLTAEEDAGSKVCPDLEGMGADMERVFLHKFDNAELLFTESGLETIEHYIQETQPRLVVLDPMTSFLDPRMDIHRSNEVRGVLSRITRMASKYDLGFLFAYHMNKGSGTKAIYRGLGSIDFIAASRNAFLVGLDPATKQRALVHIKSNFNGLTPSIAYNYSPKSCDFEWMASPCALTEEDLLDQGEAGTGPLIEEAKKFIQEFLADGPVIAKEILKSAREHGIPERIMKRAKKGVANSVGVYIPGLKGVQTWKWILIDTP